MQVPAEKRIKMADTLRLLFHYCNIVNLTLGLIVFGVGISLVLAPLPLPAGKDISVIYGTLLLTSVVVILMGILGIHGCYWVQKNRLKLYAVTVIIAMVLEAGLGSMAIIKRDIILNHTNNALQEFMNFTYDSWSEKELLQFRLDKYREDETYKTTVDNVHTVLSCCSFPAPNATHILSCQHVDSGSYFPECARTLKQHVQIKLTYIRCLALILIPIQLFCLVFDMMVLKTLRVTKEYDKLERELSNRKREKRNSMGYAAVSELENVILPAPSQRR
ncbi:hypothetical protein ACHWQZ_G013061 [Mnemiopsis leidyi]